MSDPIFLRLANKIRRIVGSAFRQTRVAIGTRYVSGPRKIVLDESETVLVCLVKDAEYYLDHLIAHHRSIGVDRFLIVDNGSSDRTRALCAAEQDVTLYSNTLPVKGYECLLRSQIARRVVTGGWFLFVDSDELIVFSRGEHRKISEFTAYCNANNYNAVIGQVLDMFSSHSLNTTADWPFSKSTAHFDQYSTDSIQQYDYDDTEHLPFAWYLRNNAISNPDIKFMFGGIRNEVFDEDCCLTTHRMVRNLSTIDLYSHAHCSGNIHCADFTFLIKHYKFCGDFVRRDAAQAKSADWDHGEDTKRVSVLQNHEDFTISGRDQKTYVDTDALIDNGFLACSDRFLEAFPKGPMPAKAEAML